MADKRTPLYDIHKALGAKMTSFGGFMMPVRYTGDLQEHLAVRNAAGIFDVSHMGEVSIRGPKAKDAVQRLITNDAEKLYPGKALYSPMCYENGTVVDDIIVMMVAADEFFICVNASNVDKDFAWMAEQVGDMAEVSNLSEDFGLLAVQGPKAREIVCSVFPDVDLTSVKRFHFVDIDQDGTMYRVSRTGYTGEDGFEVYVPAPKAAELWERLATAGKDVGLEPCGLGARDSLRLEAALPLYGHELSDAITPLEANLGWTVKLQAGDFIGADALRKQKEDGVPRKLIGITTEGRRAIPRQGYELRKDGELLGTVTSGLYSPVRECGIGLALVKAQRVAEGETLSLTVRNREAEATRIALPFVSKKS